MAKIFYNSYENTKVGTHSWYARPKFGVTLTMDDLLDDAFEGTSIEMSIGRAAVERFKLAVRKAVLRGNRCNLGDDFLTLYPNLQLSVKDREDPSTGETIVATADMLDAHNGISRIGCTVSKKFSDEFSSSVQWKKSGDEFEGTPVDNDATQNNENVENGTDNTQNMDTSTGDDGLGG